MHFRKKKLVILIATLATTQAHAEQTFTLDEMVVSATKTEQAISDVAASVDLVTAEQIEKHLAQNLEQVVETEPGVSMQGTGRFGNSGFTIRGLSNDYVKTLIDGVEQAATYDPGAGQMRKYNNTVETDTLQRVEINKGPSSTLYGSDALAGTVILRTKNPSDLLPEDGDATHASIKTGVYSADESIKGTATIANRLGKWESLFIFTHRQGGETKTHGSGADILGRERGQADPFDIDSNNVLGKLIYKANGAHEFGLTAEYFNRDAKGDILSDEGYSIMPGFTYTRNSAEDNDKRKRLSFEHQWRKEALLFDQMKWQLTRLQTDTLHKNFDHTDANGYRNRQREGKDSSTQFDLQFDKDLDRTHGYHQLTYGVSWVKNDFDLRYQDIFIEGPKEGTVEDKTGEVPNVSSVKWGAFLQDQVFLMEDALVLNGGIRYDSFKASPEITPSGSQMPSSESDAVTGKLGAVYHWTEVVTTYANVSQGFKSPTLQDLYFLYSMGAIFEPNPDLQPEESLGFETGLRYSGKSIQTNFSVFHNDYTNLIQTVRLPDDPATGREVWTKNNVEKAKIYGAELSASFALDDLVGLPQGIYSQASLAYAQGENPQTGEALDSVAPLTMQFELGYQAPDKNLGGELRLKAVDGKSDNEWDNSDGTINIKAPGYAVTDVTGYYKATDDLTLRAGVFNVFDKKYWDYQDLAGVEENAQGMNRLTQPGRNWGIELEYSF